MHATLAGGARRSQVGGRTAGTTVFQREGAKDAEFTQRNE
jgi:hypothetical protein